MHDRLPDIEDAGVVSGQDAGQAGNQAWTVPPGEMNEDRFAHAALRRARRTSQAIWPLPGCIPGLGYTLPRCEDARASAAHRVPIAIARGGTSCSRSGQFREPPPEYTPERRG